MAINQKSWVNSTYTVRKSIISRNKDFSDHQLDISMTYMAPDPISIILEVITYFVFAGLKWNPYPPPLPITLI